jgi:hypothetical protein
VHSLHNVRLSECVQTGAEWLVRKRRQNLRRLVSITRIGGWQCSI